MSQILQVPLPNALPEVVPPREEARGPSTIARIVDASGIAQDVLDLETPGGGE